MKKLIFTIILFCIFLIPDLSFALDWKTLHEAADKNDLLEAFGNVELNPQGIDDLYLSGLINLNLGNDKTAGAFFEKILDLDPGITEAQWGRAEVLRRQHKLAESQKILEECLKSDPEFFPAYNSLAYIMYTRLKFNDAVKLALKVIAAGQEGVDLSNYVRAILIYAGSKGMIAHAGGVVSKLVNGAAIYPNLKKAERLKPKDPGVLFGLGSFYLLAPVVAGGNLNRALDYLERCLAADPGFADAFVRLAQLYKAKGDLNKYALYMDKAFALDPENELALDIQSGKCDFICNVGKK